MSVEGFHGRINKSGTGRMDFFHSDRIRISKEFKNDVIIFQVVENFKDGSRAGVGFKIPMASIENFIEGIKNIEDVSIESEVEE